MRISFRLVSATWLGLVLSACGNTGFPAAPAVVTPPPVASDVLIAIGKSGGLGQVVSAPAGIDCGAICSARFAKGSTVTLVATADSGQAFIGWAGACTGKASCVLTPEADQTVTALFEPLAVAKSCESYSGPALTSLKPLHGSLHLHSSFSDNPYPSSPRDYYAATKSLGMDFGGSAEHSENSDLPIVASEKCLDPAVIFACTDPGNPDLLRKWAATQEQAGAATTPTFTAFRGFEWSSDRFGHINVFFSKNLVNDKTDGGYAITMETFYAWLTRSPDLLGGSDGLAVFNHPGDKSLMAGDTAFNWNGFAYKPAVDAQMVGMELFNGGPSPNGNYPGYFVQALDQGWHLGAVGVEDKHNLDWGQAYLGKTVILATANTEVAIKEAMQARRMYALKGLEDGEKSLRIRFEVEGHPMGSRLACDKGSGVPLKVSVQMVDGSAFEGSLNLVGPEGQVFAKSEGDTLQVALPVSDTAGQESWFFVRVDDSQGIPRAYSSPVWLKAR